MKIDLNEAKKKIVEFIRMQVDNAKADGAVIGISGGIDSAVTSYLTVQALGNRRVLGLIMPDSRITPEDDIKDAIEVAKELGIRYEMIDIAKIHSCYMKFLERNKIAEGNLRARIRMSLLYYFANLNNYLVIGTGDRSELLLGYFCFDEKTRALTIDGPKYFHQLRADDKVFSLDFSTGMIREASLGNVYLFDYYDKLHVFKSENYSFAVTPNHRMIMKDKYGLLRFIRANEAKDILSLVPYIDDENKTLNEAKYRILRLSWVDRYHGKVWCPSVARYENLIIEHDGKLAISGNTKYGDGGVDILPIADLYKSEVRALAEILGVSRRIIQKQSSPRLWKAHKAEDELGLAYSKIDRILELYFDNGKSIEEASAAAMVEVEKARQVVERYDKNEHKRKMPAICKVR